MSGGGRIGRPKPEMPVADPGSPAEAPESIVAPKAPTAEGEAPKPAYADVLDYPAHLLTQKPMLPTTLRCQLFGVDFVITTSRKAHEAARYDGMVAFTGAELEAMALAASTDRAWPATLFGWVERKRSNPSWYLTKSEALGEYSPPRLMASKHAQWTIGRVFTRLGVSLRGVEMEG